MENQQKLWEKIASEWHEHKQIPAQRTEEFLRKQKGNVLDLGSGSGRHLMKISKGKMFLVDFSQEMLNLAEKKAKGQKIPLETKQGQLFNIPYRNNFFDALICISALHCVKGKSKREKSIKEMFRVLKPGAKAYIGVWNVNSKRFSRKKKKGKELMIGWTDKGKRYYYLYDEKEIHQEFEREGFRIFKTQNSEMMINFIAKKPK